MALPSRGNEKFRRAFLLVGGPFRRPIQQEGKRRNDNAVRIVLTLPVVPPLVAGATTFPPQAGALWALGMVPHDSTGKWRELQAPSSGRSSAKR